MKPPLSPIDVANLKRISDKILAEIKEKYNLRIDLVQISGKSRAHDLVFKRTIFARHAFNMGYNIVKIGQMINRDHSTVVYLVGNGVHAKKLSSIQEDMLLMNKPNQTERARDLKKQLAYHQRQVVRITKTLIDMGELTEIKVRADEK